jgi:hypothetical protein
MTGASNTLDPLPRICQPPRSHPTAEQQYSAAGPQQGQECSRTVSWDNDFLQSRSRGGVEGE